MDILNGSFAWNFIARTAGLGEAVIFVIQNTTIFPQP
jgi:hypothetical protein